MTIRYLSATLLFGFLSTSAFSSEGGPWHYGLGLHVEQMDTKSDESFELDKSGSSAVALFLLSRESPGESFMTLGLGLKTFQVEGSEGARKQEVEGEGLTLRASHRWVVHSVELGLQTAVDYGEGTSLKVQDLDAKKKASLHLGPEFAYRFLHSGSESVITLAASWDANVPKQVNRTFALGYQYIWKESKTPSSPATAELSE